jgi:hypothetical protein
MFKVQDMQKLVDKLARLGEGAPLVFKLMSNLFTSLAFALKNNTELLNKCSSSFQELIQQIETKNFNCRVSNQQRHINYALKKAAKMIIKHSQLYLVSKTMQEELLFLSQAILTDSDIKFKTPITHLIPRIPMATIIGDSSLIACGGYSITLGFW